jgi:hypothetical protein
MVTDAGRECASSADDPEKSGASGCNEVCVLVISEAAHRVLRQNYCMLRILVGPYGP